MLGRNSWFLRGTSENESAVRAHADAHAARGLVAAGYTRLLVDDCWASALRGADGRLASDPSAFPSGMPALAEHARSRGLELGLYLTAGSSTCVCERAGSQGNELLDAATLRDWGVTTLKYDDCNAHGELEVDRFARMSQALEQAGWRERVFFQICTWGCGGPQEWAGRVGDSFRTYHDIIAGRWDTVLSNAQATYSLAGGRPLGAQADSDPLLVGLPGLTRAQQRTQFSLWAMARGPLVLSFDPGSAPDWVIDMVTNPRVLEIHADGAGQPAVPLAGASGASAYGAPLSGGRAALLLVNEAGGAVNATFSWSRAGVLARGALDAWSGGPVLFHETELRVQLPPHGDALLVLSGLEVWAPVLRPARLAGPRCYKDTGVNWAASGVGAGLVALALGGRYLRQRIRAAKAAPAAWPPRYAPARAHASSQRPRS